MLRRHFHNFRLIRFWGILLCALSINGAWSQTPTLRTVANNLGIPWGMVWYQPGVILFTDRGGRAGLLNIQNSNVTWLQGLPEVYARGQGGLLDVALPPPGTTQGWIYFTYSKLLDDGAATTLARGRLQDHRLMRWEDLLVTQSAREGGRHFGGRIAFDDDGHLFFSVGDRGDRSNGQNLMTHAATILRLNPDGTVPADNPFVGRDDALPEIYSYGHRNPQGLCYDRTRRGLWASEHGPRGGDEINRVLPGGNYGWPVVSHGREYWGPVDIGEAKSKPGMEDPHKVYVPSIAPGSLLCYSDAGYKNWRGNLFLGALKLTHLNRVVLDAKGNPTGEERLLADEKLRIRALLEGPEGSLFFSTDDGRILELSLQ